MFYIFTSINARANIIKIRNTMNKRGVANSKVGKEDKIIKNYLKAKINPNVYKSNFKIDTGYVLNQKHIYSYNSGVRKIVGYVGREYNIFNKKPYMLISLEAFELAGELSRAGYRLLTYIFRHLKVGCPKITLSNTEICKETKEKYSYVITNAKKELLDKNIIEPCIEGRANEYLINVNLLFKGRINEYLSDYGEIYGDDLEGIVIEHPGDLQIN